MPETLKFQAFGANFVTGAGKKILKKKFEKFFFRSSSKLFWSKNFRKIHRLARDMAILVVFWKNQEYGTEFG